MWALYNCFFFIIIIIIIIIIINWVNNKMLKSDLFLRAHIYNLIWLLIVTAKLSDLTCTITRSL